MEVWYLYILSGVLVTLKYAFFASIIGISFGAVIAIARISNNFLLKNISRFYISIIRGTPLIVQLSIIYFGVSGLLKADIPIMIAGLIAFSMNSSAYVAEIVRGGILAIDEGQFEAAKALSIPYHLTMKDIIIPQVFRNISPMLVNEVINLIKESAIIAIIGETDIMRRAQLVAAANYDFFSPLLFASLCYYVLVLVLSIIAKYMEDKINAKYH